MADTVPDFNAVELATELTIAWLSNANTRASAEEVPAFLARMHDAVNGLAGTSATAEEPAAEAPTEHTPAVSVRKSLSSKDHIISMIDGRPYKTLRRHLSSNGLTPDEYRQRYGLRADYPMVAENYSTHRREMAKKIGLGRKPGARGGDVPAGTPTTNDAEAQPEAAAPAPKPRGRRKAQPEAASAE